MLDCYFTITNHVPYKMDMRVDFPCIIVLCVALFLSHQIVGTILSHSQNPYNLILHSLSARIIQTIADTIKIHSINSNTCRKDQPHLTFLRPK